MSNFTPQPIFTNDAPNPIGPSSQAIVTNDFVFGAGQLGIDPKVGRLISTTAEGQMEQAIKNMCAVLETAGSDLSKVVKVTVYFEDLRDFDQVNAVYARLLGETKPARTGVEVSRIPLDGLIEIAYIATRSNFLRPVSG